MSVPVTARPVVLLLVPQLTWATAPPPLDAFAKADLSMRTADAESDAADAYLTLGKGARSAHPGSTVEASVRHVDGAGDHGLRLVDWASLARYDRSLDYAGTLGGVGKALQDAGRRWGLVSSDGEAAAVAATPNGIVPLVFPGTRDGLRGALSVQLDAAFVGVSAADLEAVLPLLTGYCAMVVSASTPGDGRHLGVLATSAECGFGTGALASPSTHHAGLATLPDVSATFLEAVGVPIPPTFSGRVVTVARPVSRQALVDRDRRTWAVDHSRMRLVWLFVLMHVVGAATVILHRRTRAVVCAILLAIPAASFLMMLVPWWRGGWWGGIVVGGGLAALIALVGILVMRRDALVGICLLAALICSVVAVDAVFGSPLEVDAPFGNSPVVAGRFFGVGNIGSGFLVASLVVVATLLFERWDGRAIALVAIAFALAVLTGSAPQFGADVGGALFAIPAYGILLLGARPRRITTRDVVLVAASALLAVVVFAVIDLARHSGSQTHLAKSLGSRELLDEMTRKAGSALGTIIAPMALIIVVATVALVLVKFSPGASRALRFGSLAVLAAAALGSLLNDSGLNVGAAVIAVAWPVGAMLDVVVPTVVPPRAAV
jgi:hypothetical protein